MLLVTYLAAIICLILLEIARNKICKVDFLTLFNIFYILLYLMPMFMFASGIVDPIVSLGYTGYDRNTSLQILTAIFLSYFMVLAGFYNQSAAKIGKQIKLNNISDRKLLGIAVFFLFFATISLHVFGMQFGGFPVAIANANLIRNGALPGGSLTFFKRFVYFSFSSSYLLASYLFIKKTKKNKLKISFLFLSSLVVAFIASLVVAARSTMIVSFGIFYLVYVIQTKKWHLKYLVPIMILAIFIILYGKAFFFSLSGLPDGYHGIATKFSETIRDKESSNYSFVDLINTFAYPIQSLYAAFNETYELRLLSDWYYALLSFLPERLLNVETELPMSYYNTQYLVNTDEFDIPTGYIAACIYSFSWPGLVFFSFIYGWIGRYLQTMMQNYLSEIYWMPFIYILTAKVWTDLLTYGDPQTFLQTNFCFLVAIVLLIFISKTKPHKMKKYYEKLSR
ncbi:oligosaccharide repeat unit polymerase [Myxosarcina sp. GI1]|uniref:oligosaccharide repeat unit polymerase n=1 Tax=Myxosarcina sp. GI1 TaxID=1541065 RepID=UPI000565EA82|nr:oligosaccharide repeat unit polymerase [Myxosarcina sp. GI1]